MKLKQRTKTIGKSLLKIIIIIILIVIFCYWQNNSIVITEIGYQNHSIPKEFNNYKIAQISDLHNKAFGENQAYLLKKLEKINPDIIVVTGDLVDSRHTNLEVAMQFIDGALKIAPVYYISGNHERWVNVNWVYKYGEVYNALIDAGVYVMEDEAIILKQGNASINLIGLRDPDFILDDYARGNEKVLPQLRIILDKLKEETMLNILLCHRPELIDLYAEKELDLVFTGHAHGGQFRLPLLGGLYAPDQGFLPKYTSGSYNKGDTTMIVSRGLGSSILPLRLFNRPEIIVVELENNNVE